MKAGKFFGFAIILSVGIGVLFLASCAPKPVEKPPKEEPVSSIAVPERIEYEAAPAEETVQEIPETPTQTRAWVPLPSKETPALSKEEILPMQMRDIPVLPPELPESEEEEEGTPPTSSGTGSSGPAWGPPASLSTTPPEIPPPPISFETTGSAPEGTPPVTPSPTPPASIPPTPTPPPPPPDNTPLPPAPPGGDIPDFVPQTNTTGPGTDAERAHTPLPPFTPITNTTGPTKN
ncbi:MAG: hypothetical protein HQ547_04260 [Candidatus Omnitrophica bacterium]|nr:hypothetical protein [Candidatus Omnitrophota bacterium]